MRKTALAALALLAACTPHKDTPPQRPEDFALVLPVTPTPGAPLQRLVLPAAALAAVQRADLGDVRLYDARGKALSLAYDGSHAGQTQPPLKEAVKTYPIAGSDAANLPQGVSITLEQPGSTVTVDGGSQGAGASEVVATLLDTRAIARPAIAVVLDADLPKGRPVTVTLERGSDLSHWEPVVSKVLLRPGDGPELLGSGRIDLPALQLKDQYIRASWNAAPGVAIKGATVWEAVDTPLPRQSLRASDGELQDAHEMLFSPSLRAPLAAIRVTMAGKDGIVPLRLYGRNDNEGPWQPLATATLRQGETAAGLELSGSTFDHYRLSADPRSAGFSAPPHLDLLVEPVSLLAAFNGEAPYKLAVGNALASPAYFAPDELAGPTGLKPNPVNAAIEAAPPGPVLLSAANPDGPFTPRKLALWAALLAGTAVLAFAAIRLMKASATPPAG